MNDTTSYIKRFEEISKTDTVIAGGKGASLGEMTRAGIPVPPGFVVLSHAFEEFISTLIVIPAKAGIKKEKRKQKQVVIASPDATSGRGDLTKAEYHQGKIASQSLAMTVKEIIDKILSSVNKDDIKSVEQASEQIRSLILKTEMPKAISQEVAKSFSHLDCNFVAVRSSATAEDSTSAAWAGQLESCLNTTKENLLENVKKCWASLFTPRAIFYRFEHQPRSRRGAINRAPTERSEISVAVVIQKMIQSEISGIAFSVHPITQDRNQMIIEAGYGLGEAIVSGQITPDSYVIGKQPPPNPSFVRRGQKRECLPLTKGEMQEGVYEGEEKGGVKILEKTISTQEKMLVSSSSLSSRGESNEPWRSHSDAQNEIASSQTPRNDGNIWVPVPKNIQEKQKLSDSEILKLSELILKIEHHYGFPVDVEFAVEDKKTYIVQSRPITTL